jgi:hypothetical protein
LAGSLGWAWHTVQIDKNGNLVTWTIDGTKIAVLDASTNGILGGNNILLLQADINATASTDVNRTNLISGIFDNVFVTADPVPEPVPYSLAILGASGLFFMARRYSKS